MAISCSTPPLKQSPAQKSWSLDPGTLIAVVRDTTGHPVEYCGVMITQQQIGGLTDAEGITRIKNVSPGIWHVSWRFLGYVSDSAVVQFQPGREETLRVLLRPR
jgi:hypothetical protein